MSEQITDETDARSFAPTDLARATVDPDLGGIAHTRRHDCPSEFAGWNQRDPECPACRALLDAARPAEPTAWTYSPVDGAPVPKPAVGKAVSMLVCYCNINRKGHEFLPDDGCLAIRISGTSGKPDDLGANSRPAVELARRNAELLDQVRALTVALASANTTIETLRGQVGAVSDGGLVPVFEEDELPDANPPAGPVTVDHEAVKRVGRQYREDGWSYDGNGS